MATKARSTAASEVDYEIVSNAGQTGAPPKLRNELIVFPEWLNPRKKANAFLLWELSTDEHSEFERSDKVYDEFGQVVKIKDISYAVRWLAYTVRDGDGNRVYPTLDAAQAALGGVPKSITNRMIALANEQNYGDPNIKSKDEASEDAEGKSEETSTDS